MVRKDSNEKSIEAFDVTVRSRYTYWDQEIDMPSDFPSEYSYLAILLHFIATIQYMSKMMNTDMYLLLLHDTKA